MQTQKLGKLLFEIDGTFLHKFEDKKRYDIAEGKCSVYQTLQKQVEQNVNIKNICLQIEDFLFVFSKSHILIRQTYETKVCYLFYSHKMELYCLSFAKNAKNSDNFAITVGQALCIVDFSSQLLDPEHRERILTHCPQTFESEDISQNSKDTLKHIAESIGEVAGTLHRLVPTTMNKQSKCQLSQDIGLLAKQRISSNAVQNWEKAKDTLVEINNTLTLLISPVICAIEAFSQKVGQQFHNSQNKFIKSVRQNSMAFCQALNEAQLKAWKPTSLSLQENTPEHSRKEPTQIHKPKQNINEKEKEGAKGDEGVKAVWIR